MIGANLRQTQGNAEDEIMQSERRRFLTATVALGIGAVVPAAGMASRQDKAKDEKKGDPEEVAAAEDLMREHGVLNRILLVYEEGLRRLRSKEDVSPDAFSKPAMLVRKFVEDYHEKLEENFIFPAFDKGNKLVDLIKVLRDQHTAGRRVTDVILRNAAPDQFRKDEPRRQLVQACDAFIRMYRPHEAREDTVLFPALHTVFSLKQLKDLGEQFEKEEDRLFGDEGFEKTVDQVAGIEKQLGIYELALFTAK
jgi:hemerythrin-like domain-containing protein